MIAPLEQELLAAFRSLRRKAQRLLENAYRIDAERGPPTHRVNSNCLKELRHAVEEACVVERWAKAQQKGTGEGGT